MKAGLKIKQLIDEKKLSITKLANILQVTRMTVYRIIEKDYIPDEYLNKIVESCGLDSDYFRSSNEAVLSHKSIELLERINQELLKDKTDLQKDKEFLKKQHEALLEDRKFYLEELQRYRRREDTFLGKFKPSKHTASAALKIVGIRSFEGRQNRRIAGI